MDTNSIAIIVMVVTFLYLGYQGVPVAFALIAGALVTSALFTKISLPSIVGQMFNGTTYRAFALIAPHVVTPEPSAVVLVGTGLMGLIAYAWRKRK